MSIVRTDLTIKLYTSKLAPPGVRIRRWKQEEGCWDMWSNALSEADHPDLLREIAELLEQGLQTQVEPFPETEKEFADILLQLRQLDPNDLKGKLIIGGFVNAPWGPDQQRCMECMYYLVHRKWCDLPELSVPVEPEWWCRLWRI